MSVINPQDQPQVTDGIGPSDPLGLFEFETVIDAQTERKQTITPHPSRDGVKIEDEKISVDREIHASRRYQSVNEVLDEPFLQPSIATLLKQILSTTVVDSETGEQLDEPGVEITIIFKVGAAGGCNPVDIQFDGQSINQFDISSGFWTINDHLASIIQQQTKGLQATQIPYNGTKYS